MKKLTRNTDGSLHGRYIAGVCGGLGEYFEIDPTMVRAGFVLFGIFGAGVLVYIILALVIPVAE